MRFSSETTMGKLNVIILSILLFIISIIWKPLIVFIVPGIAIFYFGKDKKTIEHSLVYMVMISLAFWVVSAWFVKLIGLSLTLFIYLVTIITILLICYSMLFRQPKKIEFKG